MPPSRQVAIAYAVFPFWANGFASEMGGVVIPHLFEAYRAQHIYPRLILNTPQSSWWRNGGFVARFTWSLIFKGASTMSFASSLASVGHSGSLH